MTNPLQLFPDEGVTRPPGVPETARPNDGRVHPCPRCGATSLYWGRLTFALCVHVPSCGYEWRRSGQLHHNEPLPI